MEKKNNLIHVAFIMDGNGRWAKERKLPRHLGHKEGCERLIEIYEECKDQGIQVMSLYAFSTENWNRPKLEISQLFKYLEVFFNRYLERLMQEGTRIRISGDIARLPKKTQKVINNATYLTKENQNFVLNICLNYGGRQEIVRAAKMFAQDVKDGVLDIENLDITTFENYLYTKDLPPVDLLVRTSGELRTSNYLPWQLAYAEFVFPETKWPDFTKEEFRKTLIEFYKRNRRFGGITNEEK